MEFTGELPDGAVEQCVEDWAESHLESRIDSYLADHHGDLTDGVESQIRGLLEGFDPGDNCRTARAFEEAVSGIMDHRGEIVIKYQEALLAEMVAKEVETQVSVMVVNIQQGLRKLHERNPEPEVAGSI